MLQYLVLFGADCFLSSEIKWHYITYPLQVSRKYHFTGRADLYQNSDIQNVEVVVKNKPCSLDVSLPYIAAQKLTSCSAQV